MKTYFNSYHFNSAYQTFYTHTHTQVKPHFYTELTHTQAAKTSEASLWPATARTHTSTRRNRLRSAEVSISGEKQTAHLIGGTRPLAYCNFHSLFRPHLLAADGRCQSVIEMFMFDWFKEPLSARLSNIHAWQLEPWTCPPPCLLWQLHLDSWSSLSEPVTSNLSEAAWLPRRGEKQTNTLPKTHLKKMELSLKMTPIK